MPVKLPTMGGGSGSSKELINFPFSIQTTQPTAIRAGHIWVNSDIDSKITKVKILETFNTEEENGTLMLVVGDLVNHSFSFSNLLKTASGSSKIVSVSNTISTAASWNIIDKTGDTSLSFKINNPIIYSKINGVLDIETAYIWNGTTWVLLCQKGQYAILDNSGTSTTTGLRVYNRVDSNLSFSSKLSNGSTSSYMQSDDAGTMFLLAPSYHSGGGGVVYRRNGDVFENVFTIVSSISYNSATYYFYDAKLTPDGKLVVLYGYYANSYNTFFILRVYEHNGTAMVQIREFTNNLSGYGVQTNSTTTVGATHNADCIFIAGGKNTLEGNGSSLMAYIWNGTTYQATTGQYANSSHTKACFIDTYKILWSVSDYIWQTVTIDPITRTTKIATSKTLSNLYNVSSKGWKCRGTTLIALAGTDSNNDSIVAYNVETGSTLYPKTKIGFVASDLSWSLDRKLLLVTGENRYNLYTVNSTDTSLTLTLAGSSTTIGGYSCLLMP